ncbi:MAG: SMP-30/gluconolactonase/LRE family protein [Alphaproteobacteria bacterium]|nr:MAG: SMP-30/gluconolactonase/LRE family protein [Alphaproteobacteria bacterium]
MSRPELLLDAHATIAESLLWEPRSGTLFWCDIKAPALFRLDPRTGENQRWNLPEDVGAFALRNGAREAVVALRSRIAVLSLSSGAIESVASAPWDAVRFRFNEGACDSAGRFWLGCMCDPPPGVDANGSASLHQWTSAGGLVAFGREARCHNGMAWSAGETHFYMSHSMEKVVYRYDFHAASGRLGPARIFATLDGKGIPDGAAVDEEGAYWCAHHGAGELRRYAPDGVLLHTVALPVSRVTMCAFGGHDLRTLFISSASDELSPAELRQQPLAGALFRFKPGVRGLARPTDVN